MSKGSVPRPFNKDKFNESFDRIFKYDKPKLKPTNKTNETTSVQKPSKEND
tara:strand:+ start:591 stop:743 length:153 start_codon:yes stop_codon:yes gene_type:complete